MALPQALSNWNVLGVEQRIEPHISYCNPHTDPPQWELSYWFPLAVAFLLRPPFFYNSSDNKTVKLQIVMSCSMYNMLY